MHLHPMAIPARVAEEGPSIIARAEGATLFTATGERIIDLSAGLSNVNIGYANAQVCDAAHAAMKALSFCHTLHGRSHPQIIELIDKLSAIMPASFRCFAFGVSGSDAIELAVKMALWHWRILGKPAKRKIISRRKSYHGNTIFASSLTGIPVYREMFGLTFDDHVVEADSTDWYNEGRPLSRAEFAQRLVDRLDALIMREGAENIAAFLGDPIQTGGLVQLPPDDYWPEVERLCRQHDILLIGDEVISGFGKTGRMFGFESFDFAPDLVVMAKGLSSGYFPISAVAIGDRVAAVAQKENSLFAHVLTNCGHPVGAAVALANIDVIEKHGLVARVADELEPLLRLKLAMLGRNPAIGEVRCCGVLGAIEFDLGRIDPAFGPSASEAVRDRFSQVALDMGVYLRAGTICLPMTITREELDEAFDILGNALDVAVTEAITNGARRG
nr:aminotransferase class III-fold pyridoxal phosphate-dependent enzyme [Sphingomonas sp. Y57]